MKKGNNFFVILSILLGIILITSIVINLNYFYSKPKCKEKEICLNNDSVNLYLVSSSNISINNKLLTTIENKANDIDEILSTGEKYDGFFDITRPNYIIRYSKKVISLWLNESNAMIMYESDNSIYSFDEINTGKLISLLGIKNLKTDCQFTRTYRVLKVTESNDSYYVYLTLRQFQFEGVFTVRVLNSTTFNENQDYEFTFNLDHKLDIDLINEIFDYTKLETVKKTDKTGLDQIQDNICDFSNIY